MGTGRAVPKGAGCALALAVLLACWHAPGAHAATLLGAVSDDGSRVYFDAIIGDVGFDPDVERNVYVDSGGITTRVSVPGPGVSDAAAGFAYFAGASADGSKVFFSATDFVSEDTDGLADVYERSDGLTKLVSAAGSGASGPPDGAQFVGAARDGSRVFFRTSERLVGADSDDDLDIYERSNGTTTLVSVSAGVGASFDAEFAGASTDGKRVFIATLERLAAADNDDAKDIFERTGATTTLVSAPGAGAGGAPHSAYFVASSDDGSRVFFQSRETLAGDDDDGDADDVYERAGGETTLISAAGAGASGPRSWAGLVAVSSDGATAAFATPERLVGADDDDNLDAYERSGGTTKLVSVRTDGASGPAFNTLPAGMSDDGRTILFGTYERLTSADTDSSHDYYARVDGITTLLTAAGAGANGPSQDARNIVASADATHVFFETTERLVAEDTDERNDVYERVGAMTRLVSAPGDVAAGVAHDVDWRYWLQPVSRNGETVVFETPEQLTASDDNPGPDLYARASGITRRLTATPGTVAPPPPPDTPALAEQPQPLLQTPPVGSPQAPPIGQTPTSPVTGPPLAAVRAALVADTRSAAAALRRVGRARLRRSGSFTITGVDALLAGTLTVRMSTWTRSGARGQTVAFARRTFAGAGRATVRVKLARSGRRLLRGGRRALTLILRYDDALGRSAQHSVAITLRR